MSSGFALRNFGGVQVGGIPAGGASMANPVSFKFLEINITNVGLNVSLIGRAFHPHMH